MRSGELARKAGISADTLRHYERLLLIDKPARTANGYRQYGERALDQVLLVRAALSIGFTLRELARVLAVRRNGGTPCHDVRDIARGRLNEVNEQIQQLKQARKDLENVLSSWDQLLAKSNSARAGLLESLSGNGKTHTPGPQRFLKRNNKRRKTK